VWPFTRKADASPASGPTTPALPQIRFDWKAVPPIQRLIADHPLTVPTEPFAKELATQQDPRAVAEPLGHQVSLAAPRGLVLGIAQPQTRADGPELVPGRRPSRRPEVQRTLEGPAEVPESNESADIDSTSMLGSSPVDTAVRQLPVSGAPPLQRAPLTTVGPQNAPTPLPPSKDIVLAGSEPVREAETIEAAESLPALPRLTLGQARRLGLGAPLGRVPDTSVQRAAERAAPPPAATSSAPSPPAVEAAPYDMIFPLDFPTPKPVVAPAPISRPQRIPTPLPLARSAVSAEPPAPDAIATTVAQRSAADAPAATTPAATAPEPSPVSEPETIAPLIGPLGVTASGDPRTTRLDEPAKGEWEGTDEAPLQPLPLAGSHVPAGGSETVDVSTLSTRASEGPAPPNGEPVRMAPLLSERPLITTAVQRAPETVPSSVGGGVADSVPGGLGGVRLHRGGAAAMKATAIGARAFTERDDIYLPTAHGSLSDAPARSLLAHELVHVGQQRRYGSALPAEYSAEGQRLEADAAVVERSVATSAEMTLARTAAPIIQASTTVVEAPAPWTSAASIQRAPESVSSAPAAAEAPTEFSAGQPAAAASPMKDDEKNLDELAGKLYDKIRSRLRNELLVDRERAGFLTDLR
jgi:hypothetical protein